jgi:hypothetical protein
VEDQPRATRRGCDARASGDAGRDGRTATARAALVELVPSPRPSARVPARYMIHMGEVRVEVGDDFAAETLRRIVEVLRAC